MANNSSDEIASALFQVFAVLKKRLSFKEQLFQMPLAQMETLRLIHERKLVLMKEVANFLAITPPSATVLVNNLVNLGYVERISDADDRRITKLSLTKKGAQILQRGVKQRCRDLKKLLDNVNPEEQLKLITILKKMVRQN